MIEKIIFFGIAYGYPLGMVVFAYWSHKRQ